MACQAGETHTPIPVRESSPPVGEEVPDDVVISRMETYRANVREEGIENLWMPIETVTVQLGSGQEKVNLQYRNHIITKAGETRNNILHVYADRIFCSLSG